MEIVHERIKVAIRFRSKQNLDTIEKKKFTFDNQTYSNFDYFFNSCTEQKDLYNECVKPLVLSTLDGFNAAIFTYGEYASGKSFTLGLDKEMNETIQADSGVFMRSLSDFFALKDKLNSNSKLFLSLVELEEENVKDLLQENSNSLDLEEKDNIVSVKNLTEYELKDFEATINMLKKRLPKSKKFRSHVILSINIKKAHFGTQENTNAFHLIDLASSNKTFYKTENNKKIMKIYQSLFALEHFPKEQQFNQKTISNSFFTF